MAISHADEALISFYFRADSLFARSTFGAQLERARNFQHGLAPSWAWRPPTQWSGGVASQPDPAVYVPGNYEPSHGYEVEHEDLMRFSRASKRIAAVARADLLAHAVLAAFYGDRGARWAATGAGRDHCETGQPIRGAGPGSIVALYPFTTAGQALLAKERELAARLRAGPQAAPKGSGKGKGKQPPMVGPDADVAARRAALDAVVAKRNVELPPLELAHQGARAALKVVQAEVAAARAVGAVPAKLRAALDRANRAVRAAEAQLDEVRRSIGTLRTWFPTTAFRSPLPDPEETPVGPCLEDGRFYTDPSLAGPPRLARLHRRAARPETPHLTDDELLEVVFVLEHEQPHQGRRMRLDRVRDQADGLLVRAWEAWLATAPVRLQRAA
jgi:hypothetical protein